MKSDEIMAEAPDAVASVGAADLDATCGCVDAAALLRASIRSDEHESSRN